MSNIKETIRQEIERRIKLYSITNEEEQWIVNTYWSVLAFIDSLPEEKPLENLEEVAARYEQENRQSILSSVDIVDAFIAGAEWMRKKDVEDMYMSDNRHFLKCYEQGKVDMKVAMMKDAVEGEIGYWNQTGLSIRLDQSLEKLGYDEDTKVKIIIVKQDE